MAKEVFYNATKGIVWIIEGDTVRRLGVGYSGQPPHVNDTAAEGLKASGPIPRGAYRVSRAFDHVRLGPCVMFLEPKSGEMFGRSGFFIHGDNEYGNRTASHGCIVLPPAVRREIAACAPCALFVSGDSPGKPAQASLGV